jgi:ketosteroid isomerase-like protein
MEWTLPFVAAMAIVGARDGGSARDAVLAAERDSMAAANSRDAARISALYRDDAVMILPNRPPIAAKDAVRAWIDGLAQNREIAFRYENLEAGASQQGDLGYTLSRYELTIIRPDGSRFEESGRWVQIWKRAGAAGWKLKVEITTPDTKP